MIIVRSMILKQKKYSTKEIISDSLFYKTLDLIVQYNKMQPGYDSTDLLGLFK